jgi:PAS domain S-box-containing protein
MNKKNIHILLIEDNRADAALLKQTLQRQYKTFKMDCVENEAGFARAMQKKDYDIILSDYMLPSYSGMDALKYRNEHFPLIPFIIVTGSLNESIAVDCMKAGADDYIIKEHLDRLGMSIKRAIQGKQTEKEKIRAEQALQHSAEYYERLFALSPSGLILEDEKGNILDANEAILRLTGYSREELVGNHISMMAPVKDKKRIQQNIKHILSGETLRQEVINIGKGGKRQYAELIDTRIQLPNGRLGILSVNNDITERKRAEEALRQTNERLSLAQEVGKFGSWDWDIITGKRHWSDQAYLQFGLTPGEEEPSQELFDQFTHPEEKEKIKKAIEKAIENKETYDLKVRMFRKDGSQWIMHTVGKLFEDKAAGTKRMIGIQQDITEEVKITHELIRAKEKAEESDRLKSEFLANLSHEIRTPMNGIMGFSNLLTQDEISDEERKNYASIVTNSSKQLLRIIDDILEISKLQTHQVKAVETEVSLSDIMMELFSIYDLKARESGLHLYLKNELQGEEAMVFTDEGKLLKILGNLMENALKFTHAGQIDLGLYRIKNKLKFYVKDTGVGIRKEMIEKIFDRFSQEEKAISQKAGGLGLGLSIARENARLLGGSISVESEKGKGSTFMVEIPYKPVYKKVPSGKIKKQKNLSILVVEDEEVNYQYIEILLRKSPYPLEIYHATSGIEAIEFCQKHPEVKLVLMDLKMPGMNGFEASQKIKSFRPDLPILAQTAYSSEADQERAAEAGCDAFLSKPFKKEEFYHLIENFLIQ